MSMLLPPLPPQSALTAAINRGDVKRVEALLLQGADFNEVDELDRHMLRLAVDRKDIKIARLLLERGADVNKTTHMTKITPLMAAAHAGSIDMARLLIQNGADVDLRNRDGKTALMIAEQRNFKEMIQLLKNVDPARRAHADITRNQQLLVAHARDYVIKRRPQP